MLCMCVKMCWRALPGFGTWQRPLALSLLSCTWEYTCTCRFPCVSMQIRRSRTSFPVHAWTQFSNRAGLLKMVVPVEGVEPWSIGLKFLFEDALSVWSSAFNHLTVAWIFHGLCWWVPGSSLQWVPTLPAFLFILYYIENTQEMLESTKVGG